MISVGHGREYQQYRVICLGHVKCRNQIETVEVEIREYEVVDCRGWLFQVTGSEVCDQFQDMFAYNII